ncbi:MAG: Ig-like domain-containing protein, partial [Candidatus Thorarchaeota archaeon]
MKKKIGLVVLSFMLILTILNFAPQVDTISAIPNATIQNEVSLSATPSIPPPPGMIAYWELNENGGITVSDSIVPYVTGTTAGGPRWVPGIAQSGLEILEGQFIGFGRPSYLYLPEVLTIEAWVNLPDPSGLHTIIMNAYNPSNIQYHFGIQDGHLYFDRQAGAPGNEVTSMASINPDQWHHVVVVMNWGLRRVWFYLDGVDEEIYPYNDGYTGPSGEVTIGADRITGAPSFLNGSIDEVAIYNDMLDQAIIQEHYQKGSRGLGYLDELPVNNPPVALDDVYTLDQYSTLMIDAPGVLSNDYDDDGDPLETMLLTDVSNGVLVLNADGSFVYTPSGSFVGTDIFEYRVYDGVDYSESALVSLTVEMVNEPPVGTPDEYTTAEDTPLSVSSPGVLSNDVDSNPSDYVTAELHTTTTHGTLTFFPEGAFEYTPDLDWYGTDAFVYRPFDGHVYGDQVTVTITVTSVNDAPIAYSVAFVGTEDVDLYATLPLATDVDGDVPVYELYTGPSYGVLTLDAGGTFGY